MQISEAPIHGVYQMRTQPHSDKRGWFGRIHCVAELRAAGIPEFELVQANLSHTERRGAFRGLHYQMPPHTETKIVRCIRGEVVDFVVDLRRDSETFLQVHQETLSDSNQAALYIPRGCAHGFQVISDGADLLYLHDTAYNEAASRTVHVESPAFAIQLPLPVSDLSDRDRLAEKLSANFEGIVI